MRNKILAKEFDWYRFIRVVYAESRLIERYIQNHLLWSILTKQMVFSLFHTATQGSV